MHLACDMEGTGKPRDPSGVEPFLGWEARALLMEQVREDACVYMWRGNE